MAFDDDVLTRRKAVSFVSIPAGWYPNPQDPNTQRYWSGTEWTDQTVPLAIPEPTIELPTGPLLPPSPYAATPVEPWYRKKWVWVAAAVIVVGSIGALAAGNDDTKDAASGTKPKPIVTTVTEPPATVTVPPAEDVAATPTESQVGSEPETDGDTFAMPNEAGKDLQAAQDDLQAITGNSFFSSDSEDATGQDRFQVWDRNWLVCSQKPSAGTKIPTDYTDVVLYVVKDDESCP